ncbi:MAG TPA: alpha/beta hydrolase [Planctomycetota bacterium]|nr:alpha/beta hydrolase [Planctomycetota bacterium]
MRPFHLPLLLLPVAAGACRSAGPLEDFARSADGVPIAYDVRGRGGTALVFVHGWCGDRAQWRNQVDEFSSDHTVVTLDLGGHGASGANRKTWDFDALAGDVVAVVDRLELPGVILVGHSMGGPVCLLAAARMPGRVIAVVGVDTLHASEFETPTAWLEETARSLEADFRGSLRNFVGTMFEEGADPSLPEWVCARAERTDRTAAFALLRAFAKYDAKAALAGAKVPVRCINAAEKPPRRVATTVATNRKYADFDAVFLDRVGHFPHLERPREFNAAFRGVILQIEGEAARRRP